jgi:hypothetical protein
LTAEIGNQEPYPLQDLIKWMKKEEPRSIKRKMREKFNTETHVFLLHGIKIGKKLSKTHKFSEKTLLSDI